MPHGDVTPEGCLWTLTVAQISEHRPVHSVPPTRPLNPTTAPAAPHVDPKEFPGLAHRIRKAPEVFREL